MHKRTANITDPIFSETKKLFLNAIQKGDFEAALHCITDNNKDSLCTSTTTTKGSNVFHLLYNYFASPKSKLPSKIALLNDPNHPLPCFLSIMAPYALMIQKPNNENTSPIVLLSQILGTENLHTVCRYLNLSVGTQDNNKNITYSNRHKEAWIQLNTLYSEINSQNLTALLLGPGINTDSNIRFSSDVKELIDHLGNRMSSLICVDKSEDVLLAASEGSPAIPNYYGPTHTKMSTTNTTPSIQTRLHSLQWSGPSFEQALEGHHDLIVALNILTYPFEEFLTTTTTDQIIQKKPVQIIREIIDGTINRLSQILDHLNENGRLLIDQHTVTAIACPFLQSTNDPSHATFNFLRLLIAQYPKKIAIYNGEGGYYLFQKTANENPTQQEKITQAKIDYSTQITSSFTPLKLYS